MDINYYIKLQNAYGTQSNREKDLAKVNYEMSKHFEDTFDTEDVLLNGEPFKLMIIKDTDGNTYKKKIKSKHCDKFNLGDYIEWNDQHWIVTLIDTDEKTWNRGYMYQCTILLRWQNTNGKIIERWGYSEDFTKYATGTYGNNYMTLGEYQYGITLPVDEETKFLKRDRRFAVGIDGVEPPDVYKTTNRKILLTDNRYFKRGGILTLTLSYSEFNSSTDKKITLANGSEVWICDYETTPLSSDVIVPNVPSIRIVGTGTLKYRNRKLYAVAEVTENGEEEFNDEYGWNIVSDFSLDYDIKQDGIELFVDNEDDIGRSFLLQAVNTDGAVLAEKEIKIVGVF